MITPKKFIKIIASLLSAVCLLCSFALFVGCNNGDDTDKPVIKRSFKNVAYTDDATKYQYLDVLLPTEGEGPYPLVIFVHGGGWFSLHRNYGIFDGGILDTLNKSGYAIAKIDYTLSQEMTGKVTAKGGFPQNVKDIKTAIRHLRANAETYRIDPDNIVLLGESAGAHLSLLCAATEGNFYYEDLTAGNPTVSSHVNAVVSICAPTLFLPDDTDWFVDEAMKALVGVNYTEDDIKAVSPYYQVTDSMVPCFLTHGRNDTTVPFTQSEVFSTKLKEVIGESKVETLFVDDAPHVDPTFFNSADTVAKIKSFIDKYTK